MTLDVRVEDLHGGLHEAAAGEMLVVLDERQPRLQQLVVGLHVNHVVLVQLGGQTGEFFFLFRPEFLETILERFVPSWFFSLFPEILGWCVLLKKAVNEHKW